MCAHAIKHRIGVQTTDDKPKRKLILANCAVCHTTLVIGEIVRGEEVLWESGDFSTEQLAALEVGWPQEMLEDWI
ncbi:MAG: hypothetical protein PHX83_11950 [Acidobacteriia bacterium]|nr:hypothetical protein [Terriglobia bacterium]